MAWYHSGSCDCPMGCCGCGVDYVYVNRKTMEIRIFTSGYDRVDHNQWSYVGEL